MFGFGYTDGGAWSDDGIKAIGRFVDRIERTVDTGSYEISKESNNKTSLDEARKRIKLLETFCNKRSY